MENGQDTMNKMSGDNGFMEKCRDMMTIMCGSEDGMDMEKCMKMMQKSDMNGMPEEMKKMCRSMMGNNCC